MIIVRTLLYLALLIGMGGALLMSIGSSPDVFWDLPSALFVIAGGLLTLVNFQASEMSHAFQDAMSKNMDSDFQDRYRVGKKFWQTLGTYTILAGSVGTIIGLVQALGNLDDVNSLAVATAVSMLSVLYGLGIRFFLAYPLEVALDKKILMLEE